MGEGIVHLCPSSGPWWGEDRAQQCSPQPSPHGFLASQPQLHHLSWALAPLLGQHHPCLAGDRADPCPLLLPTSCHSSPPAPSCASPAVSTPCAPSRPTGDPNSSQGWLLGGGWGSSHRSQHHREPKGLMSSGPSPLSPACWGLRVTSWPCWLLLRWVGSVFCQLGPLGSTWVWVLGWLGLFWALFSFCVWFVLGFCFLSWFLGWFFLGGFSWFLRDKPPGPTKLNLYL